MEAQELLARLALEDNNNAKATEEADKALAMRPEALEAKAILATIDWLADKKDTPVGSARRADRATRPPAHFFVLNRRYEEGIEFYRKAIELDPHCGARARSWAST